MFLAFVAAAVLAADAAPAAEAAPVAVNGVTAAGKKPEQIVVGVYVNQIHEFSLRENSFTVDFYVWFRWKNPELKPYETFSVVDGRVESKTDPQLKDLPGGEKHAWVRVVAKITRFFDTSDYPLDNHQLAVTIEEENQETTDLVYVADTVNSAASKEIKLGGWVFERLSTVAAEQRYTSNFGDTTLPTGNESRYSRVTTAIAFTRQGATYFFKLFFALWVCTVIAFLAFFIKPTDVDPRFGLGVGALFAAIASQYTVASALPDSNVITLADQLHLVGFAFIFLSLAQSTFSLWLFQTEKEKTSKLIDRVSRVVFPIAYIIANFWAVGGR